MTLYHNLDRVTYKSFIADGVTKTHGLSTWRAKHLLVIELTKMAKKHKVLYD